VILAAQVHGHDDVQEVIFTHRAEDTGRGINIRF
jgi:hypothetical protein